jgi:hypothetical protein
VSGSSALSSEASNRSSFSTDVKRAAGTTFVQFSQERSLLMVVRLPIVFLAFPSGESRSISRASFCSCSYTFGDGERNSSTHSHQWKVCAHLEVSQLYPVQLCFLRLCLFKQIFHFLYSLENSFSLNIEYRVMAMECLK